MGAKNLNNSRASRDYEWCWISWPGIYATRHNKQAQKRVCSIRVHFHGSIQSLFFLAVKYSCEYRVDPRRSRHSCLLSAACRMLDTEKSVVEKKNRNNRNENCAITLRYDGCWNVPTFTICYRALLERIWVENVGRKTRLNPEWTQFCRSIKLQWAAWNFLYELSHYVENMAEHSLQTKQDTKGFSRLLKIQVTNKTHLDKVWLNFQLMWNFFFLFTSFPRWWSLSLSPTHPWKSKSSKPNWFSLSENFHSWTNFQLSTRQSWNFVMKF